LTTPLVADETAFASEWPASGPPKIWSRPLGPGYSGIVAVGDRVCTMTRDAPDEVVTCLDARTGDTLWEQRYAAPLHEIHDSQYGDGPNAPPLIDGPRLCTAGVSGLLHCYDVESGEPLWSRNLWGDLGGNPLELGYASAPIAYGGMIVALVGAKDAGVVAFDATSGEVVWRSAGMENTFGSPRIVELAGRDQLVTGMAGEYVGLDPRDGTLLWRVPLVNQWRQDISRPLPIGDDSLFLSTMEAGSTRIRLSGDGSSVEELWSSRRMQLFYTDPVLVGGLVIGSSGYSASPLVVALDVETGELAWRVRGFAVANLLKLDDRLLIYDEDGTLALATPGPDGLTVHAEAVVSSAPARTPPTLVGATLYVRDFREIAAFDLGR
jgi:outer membrane protein assembly factor BamB